METRTVDRLERGGRLVTKYRGMEQVEASWLEELGGFDADEEWRLFGHGSCPDWLMTFLDLSRATAFEKVRVARMLRRRPVLTASYREGRVSYSKVRAITRLEEIDTEMEQVFTALAEEAGLTEVEHAVRAYQLHHEQEMPPRFRTYRRGCRIRPVGDGLCQVTAILTELEAAELERLLDEVIQKDAPPAGAESPAVDWVSSESPESPAADCLPAESPAVDCVSSESPAGDWWDAWVITSQEYAERRADALMDLLGQARDYLYADRSAVDVADRYLVHVIVDPDGHASLPDGAPLSASEAAVVMCGAPVVTHEFGADGNPLYQGRKTREWTTAQRRAALVRDGHCRFPGCWRRRADLHHQWFWATGGPTDIDNGLLLCRFHHHVVHKEAYQITGNPGGVLTFTQSDGRRIGYTQPVRRALVSRELISRKQALKEEERTMAVCNYCGQEMLKTVSCTDAPIVIRGVAYKPIRNGRNKGRCGDCGAPPGAVHHHGCDMERCPACRGQSIACGCVWAGEEHLSEEWLDELEEVFLLTGPEE